MQYSIKNIIDTDKILIKRLTYTDIPVEEIDLNFFTKEELSRYETFISDKRRREFYFTRVLLRSFNLDLVIQYRDTGKPIINEGHISISHSRNNVVIGYSKDHIIGVDIEFFNPKIHRVKFKFLASIEKERFDIENEEVLTLIWSIKEAIYKMEDIPGLLFKEHILVHALSHRGDVRVIKNGVEHDYVFDFLIFNDFVITYCYLLS
ncbi:MAG: 4'-phosphopantetheinyl transferase superfamily protein [Crocinitomicaceae bacterium]|nr:4'-phosphopantetheinyl transferase superfamily protein [Crocinitomicaceae bacterium]